MIRDDEPDAAPGPAEEETTENEPSKATAALPEATTTIPPNLLPVLSLRNTVLFPSLFVPLSIGRTSSVAAAENALASEEKTLLVVAQRDQEVEDVEPHHLYHVATRAVIKKMARNNDALELIVQGIERVTIDEYVQQEPFLKAHYTVLPTPEDSDTEVEALQRAVIEQATHAFQLVQHEQPNINFQQMLNNAGDPLRLAYLLASMMSLEVSKEQAILEASTRREALRLLHESMTHEIQVLELRQQIASQAQSEMSREQRDYFLRQQLRAIQQELGERTPESVEIAALRDRLARADLPESVAKEVTRDLERLERLPTQAPDYQVTRAYIELVLELPWKNATQDNLDLAHARQILDEDHYGLAAVKERILEQLAVLKLNPEAKAPILCFVGPPGVGKTSLGQSIARAIGRHFERMSLGGLHDEAELRGHRRTYIGAMPGRIIQAVRRAGVNNPLLMLDEIDKLGRDYRGDPAAALLEILDPAQNHTFRDNYLDMPFDLSNIFFIATANTLDTLPRPLLDRMEVLRLTGYSEEEKVEIARRYLVPRILEDTGLPADAIHIGQDTLSTVIHRYTREAGCRQLDRALGQLFRKIALHFAEGATQEEHLTPERVPELLGPEPFHLDAVRASLPVGVATGLAWTETGGDVLYVEASLLQYSKKLRLTGQLGGIMKESAKAAQSYVWAHASELGIAPKTITDRGVHIHVPAGAVPKDGPSAGVALVSALASLYSDRPVRSDVAMTGEITLSGLVLPIGGVKEKVLAARRAGIHQVILPKANEKDLPDLPENVRAEMTIHFADTVSDVLNVALQNGSSP